MNRILTLLLVTVPFLPSCMLAKPTEMASENIPAPVHAPAITDIRAHQRVVIDAYQDIQQHQDYGAYTFILTNRGESYQQSWDKYLYLIQLVDSISSAVSTSSESSLFDREHINLFVIPNNQNLSLAIAQKIRSQLQQNQTDALDNIGPYLVTVFDNNTGNSPFNTALIADLSNVNQNAFPDLVNEYESFLRQQKSHDGIKKFEHFRISLISKISDLGDYIKIAQAYASTYVPDVIGQ